MKMDTLKTETKAFEKIQNEIKEWRIKLNVDQLRFQFGNWSGEVTDIRQPRGRHHADFVLYNGSDPVFCISHKAVNFAPNGFGSVGKRERVTKLNKHKDPRFRGWAQYAYDHLAATLKENGLTCTGPLSWGGAHFNGIHTRPPSDLEKLIVYGPDAGKNTPVGCLDFTPLFLTGTPTVTEFNEGERVFTIKSDDGVALLYPNLPTGENTVWLTAHDRIGGQGAPQYINANTYWFKDSSKSFAGWIGVFPERERIRSLTSAGGKMSKSKLVEYPAEYIEKYCMQIGQ